MIAKRRHDRKLAGVSTTVGKTYGDTRTVDHYRITEGYGLKASGGSQVIGCVKERALNFGDNGLTDSTD